MAITSENKKALVKFYRGNLTDYDAEQFGNVIYFAEDSHILRMNGKTYSGVIDVEYKKEEGKLKLIFDKELGDEEVVTKEIDLGAKDIQLIDYEAADRETGMGTLLKESILEDTESVQDALALLDTALRLEIERSAQGRGNITKTLAEENERAKKAENHIYDKVLALIDAHNDTRERMERMMEKHPKVIVGNDGGDTPVMSVTPNGETVKISYDIEDKKGEGTYKLGKKQEITLSAATSENAGVMPASDKKKVDEFFNGWDESKSLDQVLEEVNGSITNEQNRAEGQEQALQQRIENEETRAKQAENKNHKEHQQLVNGLPQDILANNGDADILTSSVDATNVTITVQVETKDESGNYSPTDAQSVTIASATSENAGLMSATDKDKLDKAFAGLPEDKSIKDTFDEVNSHLSEVDDSLGSLPEQVLAGTSEDTLLTASAGETDVTVTYKREGKNESDIYSPSEDGTVVIPGATGTAAGVMSAADKAKMDQFFGEWSSESEDGGSLSEVIENLKGSVENEKNRAETQEGELQKKIEQEETRAKGVENSNKAAIDALEDNLPVNIVSSNSTADMITASVDATQATITYPVKSKDAETKEYGEETSHTTVIPSATATEAGLMSASDKVTFDDFFSGWDPETQGSIKDNLDKLQADISAEESRANGVEQELRSQLTAEQTRATNKEGELEADIADLENGLPGHLLANNDTSPVISASATESTVELSCQVQDKTEEGTYIPGTAQTVTLPAATATSAGMMSAADKARIDEALGNMEPGQSVQDQMTKLEEDISSHETTLASLPVNVIGNEGTADTLLDVDVDANVATFVYEVETLNPDTGIYEAGTNQTAVLNSATEDTAGLLSAADKKKIDSALAGFPDEGGTSIADQIGAVEADVATNTTTIGSLPTKIYGTTTQNTVGAVTPTADAVNITVQVATMGDAGTYEEGTTETLGIPAATSSAAGVLTAADKAKIDSALSGFPTEGGTSIQDALDAIEDDVATNTTTLASLPKNVIGGEDGTTLITENADATNVKLTCKVEALSEEGVYAPGTDLVVNIPSATTSAAGALSSTDKGRIDNAVVPTSVTKVTSLTSIPITNYTIEATLSSSATALSFASTPADGQEFMIEVKNSGSAAITINLPNESGWQSDNSSITIAAGKIGSISVHYVFSTYVVLSHGA